MSWIKIIARFTGNSSLGFTHNNTYKLNVDPGGYIHTRIRIVDSDNRSHACEYSRLEMFVKNWEVISYQKDYLVGSSKQEPFLDLESEFTKLIRNYKLSKLIDA